MEKFRLLYINHGLKEAHNRFHESLKMSDKQNSVSYAASLSELLMWICISDEWHFKNNNKDKYYDKIKSEKTGGNYVKGLRYAFNSIKHVMTFTALTRTTGRKEIFISGYQTEDYTTESKWANIDNLIEYDEQYKNQRDNYKKYIEDKPVIETVNAACDFLYNEYIKLRFDS